MVHRGPFQPFCDSVIKATPLFPPRLYFTPPDSSTPSPVSSTGGKGGQGHYSQYTAVPPHHPFLLTVFRCSGGGCHQRLLSFRENCLQHGLLLKHHEASPPPLTSVSICCLSHTLSSSFCLAFFAPFLNSFLQRCNTRG